MSEEISGGSKFLVGCEKLVHYLKLALTPVVGFLALAVFFCVTANVFGRYVMNDTYEWAAALSRYFFIWLVLLGGGLGCLCDENISVTFIKDNMPRFVFNVLEVVKILVIYGVCVVIFIGYAELASGFVGRTPLLGMSQIYLYMAMLALAALMLLANTMDLLRFIVRLQKKS